MKIKKVIIGVTIGITAAILWSVVFINVLNSMAGIGIGICLGISFGISGSLIFSKKIKINDYTNPSLASRFVPGMTGIRARKTLRMTFPESRCLL